MNSHQPSTDPTSKSRRTTALSRRMRIEWGTIISVAAIVVTVGMTVGCSLVEISNRVTGLTIQAERRDREVDQMRGDMGERLDRMEDKIDRLLEKRIAP